MATVTASLLAPQEIPRNVLSLSQSLVPSISPPYLTHILASSTLLLHFLQLLSSQHRFPPMTYLKCTPLPTPQDPFKPSYTLPECFRCAPQGDLRKWHGTTSNRLHNLWETLPRGTTPSNHPGHLLHAPRPNTSSSARPSLSLSLCSAGEKLRLLRNNAS